MPLGAVAAGGSFFLPYVRVLRVLGMAVTLEGPRIGGALWLVPATAVAILLVHFTLARRRRLRAGLTILGALFGLLIVAGVIARLHHRTGLLFVHFSAATFGVRPAVGWLVSLAGFALVLVGGVTGWRARPAGR